MATHLETETPQQEYIPFRMPTIAWGTVLKIVGYVLAVVFLLWLGDRIGDNPRGVLQASINGLLIGGIYSLVAVGIVIIIKATGIFNFAHGGMMLVAALAFRSFFVTPTDSISIVAVTLLAVVTVAAFLAMNSLRELLNPIRSGIGAVVVVLLVLGMTQLGDDLRLVRALIGGLTVAVLMGLLIERLSIRPLVGQPIFTMILMTLALDALFRGLGLMLWGSIDRSLGIFRGLFQTPGVAESEAWKLPAVIRVDAGFLLESRITTLNVDSRVLIAFGVALLLFVIFIAFFQYTNVGLAMRATSENQVLAQSVGMRVRVVLAIAWMIAALLALAAGVLYGAATNVGTGMAQLVFLAFPAVLLGGLESIGGALVGGIVIGLAQSFGDYLFANDAGTQLVPYVILMVVLVVRPDGLFGQKRIERI
ncbi:MAG: branched-chain amino acid ABC transporter permease [Anaerolineaceae bacterium]|nr:MAG: branched-chain amino acid ABC transporter permease [Anaerolineaceae bacterium]